MDIYYISACIRSIQTPLTPDKPGGSVLEERAVCQAKASCSRVWKLPCSAGAALDTLSFPNGLRTAWSHLASKSELFAVSKQQRMNLGLSLFTLWRIRPRSSSSANTPTWQLPSCSRSIVPGPQLMGQGQGCSVLLTATVPDPKKHELWGLSPVNVKARYNLKVGMCPGGPEGCGTFIPLGCIKMGPKMPWQALSPYVCKIRS